MTTTATLLEDLAQLSDIDLAKRRLEPKSARSIELTKDSKGVRERIPASVLIHYDTRISRGKRGAARMRNNTCGGCNLALPSGQLADMRHADAELVLCCNCSIYLLPSLPPVVDPDAAPVVAKPAVKKVAVKKPRKPKVAKAIAADEAQALADAESSSTEDEVEAEAEAEAEVEAQAEADAEVEAEVEAEEEDVAATPEEVEAELALPAEAAAETAPQEEAEAGTTAHEKV